MDSQLPRVGVPHREEEECESSKSDTMFRFTTTSTSAAARAPLAAAAQAHCLTGRPLQQRALWMGHRSGVDLVLPQGRQSTGTAVWVAATPWRVAERQVNAAPAVASSAADAQSLGVPQRKESGPPKSSTLFRCTTRASATAKGFSAALAQAPCVTGLPLQHRGLRTSEHRSLRTGESTRAGAAAALLNIPVAHPSRTGVWDTATPWYVSKQQGDRTSAEASGIGGQSMMCARTAECPAWMAFGFCAISLLLLSGELIDACLVASQWKKIVAATKDASHLEGEVRANSPARLQLSEQ